MVKKSTQNVYFNKQYKLTEYPKFLYEVSLYKVWKDRAECVGSQFYAADKPLDIKKETTSTKVEDYRLIKFITWLSAPLDYMLSNGFTLYDESDTKRKPSGKGQGTIRRGKGDSNIRKRS